MAIGWGEEKSEAYKICDSQVKYRYTVDRDLSRR